MRRTPWDTKKEGVYKCAIGGLPLFSSEQRFSSGTGWLSFTGPIDPDHVLERIDSSNGMVRREVICAKTGGHLGHVFDDGPPPSMLRYCINAAALRFEAAEGQDDDEDPNVRKAEASRAEQKLDFDSFGGGDGLFPS